MKIRIGNDICLNVTLLYNVNNEYANIHSVEAFLINASKEAEFEADIKDKTKFISRFPVEPYIDAYSSTAYDIKSSGYPTWRAYPRNHVYATYSGFGLHPDWRGKYRHMPKYNLTQYRAEVKYTQDRSTIKVFFPAEQQLYTGTYNLIVVAKIYDPGYSKNNLRTVTMDYENVFILVNKSSDGIDGPVTLDVASTSRSGAVQKIEIHGDTLVGENGVGMLSAKVSPVGVDDSSVSWSVADDDATYLAITNKQPNSCKYVALGLPDGEDSHVATVYATSNQTPGVHGEIKITIDKSHYSADTYVYSGQYDGNLDDGGNINLNLTNGQQVDIDLGKAIGWYEGN